jgi:hypothetical protein
MPSYAAYPAKREAALRRILFGPAPPEMPEQNRRSALRSISDFPNFGLTPG